MTSNLQKPLSILLLVCFSSFLFLSPAIAEPPQPPRPDSPDQRQMATFDPAMAVASPAEASVTQSGLDNSKITLELKGVDVLDVLKIIASRSSLNIVAGKNVRGQVTIYLKDVEAKEALDVIVSALGLAYIEDQKILKVMTDKEYEQLRGRPFRDPSVSKAFKIRHVDPKAVQQVIQQLKGPGGRVILDERTNTLIVSDLPELVKEIEMAIESLDEPLVTQVYKLKYGSVEDLEEQLKDYITPETGILKVDKRSNQVSVTDRKEKVDQISKVVESFDVRPPQVLIEAQVVEVELIDAFRWGVDWEYVRSRLKYFRNVNLQQPLTVTAPGSDFGSGTLNTYTFDGPVKGLNTIIQILQNVGKANTLSAPRITVLNNEEAKLVDATRQPYVTSTVVPQTTTVTAGNLVADTPQFIDVGVTLTVVPTISDNNTVVLKLKPEVSTQAAEPFSYQTATGAVTTAYTRTVPIVSTQTLETTVVVKSGETLIVGGLIKDQQSKTNRKIPFFGDIPVLGAAFKSSSINFGKTELVIFLTPYIVSGDVGTKEHEKFLKPDGQLVPFDQVGGYDFGIGQKHSQGPFDRDAMPYWEVKKLQMPKYWAPHDVYTRDEPYQDKTNQFEGGKEGKAPFSQQALRKEYEVQLAQRVIPALDSVKELQGLKGNFDLAISVRRDGVLNDVSFIDAGEVKDKALRRKILQTVRNVGPLPEFPKDLTSDKELFELRFGFQKPQPPAKKK